MAGRHAPLLILVCLALCTLAATHQSGSQVGPEQLLPLGGEGHQPPSPHRAPLASRSGLLHNCDWPCFADIILSTEDDERLFAPKWAAGGERAVYSSFVTAAARLSLLEAAARVRHRGAVIFCKTELVRDACPVLLALQTPFVLLSAMSDATCSPDVIPRMASLLDHAPLQHWFATNLLYAHPKLHPVPIGLESPVYGRTQEGLLVSAWRTALLKSRTLHCSFSNTHPTRAEARSILASRGFCTPARHGTWADYVSNLQSCAFCACPRGNGLDCHRTWEALLCRCTPVLRHRDARYVAPLLAGLPHLLVSDFDALTSETLKQAQLDLAFPPASAPPPDVTRQEHWRRRVEQAASLG